MTANAVIAKESRESQGSSDSKHNIKDWRNTYENTCIKCDNDFYMINDDTNNCIDISGVPIDEYYFQMLIIVNNVVIKYLMRMPVKAVVFPF